MSAAKHRRRVFFEAGMLLARVGPVGNCVTWSSEVAPTQMALQAMLQHVQANRVAPDAPACVLRADRASQALRPPFEGVARVFG